MSPSKRDEPFSVWRESEKTIEHYITSPKNEKGKRTALSCRVAIDGQSGERTCQCHVGKGHVNEMSKEVF